MLFSSSFFLIYLFSIDILSKSDIKRVSDLVWTFSKASNKNGVYKGPNKPLDKGTALVS